MARHLSIGKIKIIPGLGAAVIALLLLASPGKAVKADGNIPIDEEHFPDKNFRAEVAEQCDKDEDGELSEEEINNTYSLYIQEKGIKSLEGIECFKELDSLYCDKNELAEIDVSKNTALRSLDCSKNKLTELDLSKNTELVYLTAGENSLSKINLSKNEKLTSLDLNSNLLTKIDLSKNKEIEFLVLNNNKIKTIDLKNNSKITGLYLIENEITDFDISGLPELAYFNLSSNKLKKIDLTKNTKLETVFLDYNELDSIDLSKNKKLGFLGVSFNKLTKLDVSKNKELFHLYCNGNMIKSLSLANNYQLGFLYCGANALTSLDVSKNLKLRELSVTNLELKELDLSKNSVLARLYCYNSKIEKLDITENPKLVEAVTKGDLISDKLENGTIFYKFVYEKGNPDSDDYILDELIYGENTQIIDGTPGSVKLDKAVEQLVCGKSLTLKATLKDISGKVTWKSSDPSVASVDSKGKVTTKMAGTVTIIATVKTKRAACKVTVLYKDVTKTSDFWFTPTNSLTERGIVKGYDKQTKFKPSNECTRAQMLTFIWRLCGSPEPNAKECKFPDVKKGDYFYKPVIWAVEKGITTGYNDGTFKPQNVCTRAQTVTFLWRLAGKPSPKTSTCKFKDVKAKDYFFEPVIWASERKIVAGYKNGTFKPQGKCLRRQMVTFLYKFNSWAY